MLQATRPLARPPVRFPRSFREWRGRLAAARVLPVIAIAGSRGKTTVVRLLDAIFRDAGLRTALWTDRGIEVNGRRQRGELVPWSRALRRLGEGGLDLAIQELDWSTVHAVGLPAGVYPVVAVTNLCVNSDSCLLQSETRRALRSLAGVRAAAHRTGVLVLNGEDFAVAGDDRPPDVPTILVGVSRDTPLVREHLRTGGTAAWTRDGLLRVGDASASLPLGSVADLPLALGGSIGFQVHNALTAATVAAACGIPAATITATLRDFSAPTTLMPGSFNVVPVGAATVVVERPAASWFLRPALRAVAHLPCRRLLRVASATGPIPESDLVEVGRLLGRGGGALVLHGEAAAPVRAALLRQGVAANEVPPVVIHAGTERQALGRALKMLRSEDLLLVLAEQPAAVLRALDRVRARADATFSAGLDDLSTGD